MLIFLLPFLLFNLPLVFLAVFLLLFLLLIFWTSITHVPILLSAPPGAYIESIGVVSPSIRKSYK